MHLLGDQAGIFIYVIIINRDVLIIIQLLVFIIGKLCSRLSQVESKTKTTQSHKNVIETEPVVLPSLLPTPNTTGNLHCMHVK